MIQQTLNNSPTSPFIVKDILKKYDEKYNAIDTPIEPMIKTTTIIRYSYNGQGQTQITYRYCNHKVLDQYNEEINDSNHIGHLNPFRYHGYQYDRETDLYYLKTRYYDPKTGRFISSDHTSFLREDIVNGLNLYAYCGNNPVMNVDPEGTFFFTGLMIALAAAKAVVIGVRTGLVGGSVYQRYNVGDTIWDFGIIGIEQGAYVTQRVGGSNRRPIMFNVTNASNPWRFWEWRVGVDINIGNGGFGFDIGAGSGNININTGNTDVSIGGDFLRAGVTVSRNRYLGNSNYASSYEKWFTRPWLVALTVVTLGKAKKFFIPGAPSSMRPRFPRLPIIR